MKDDPIFEEVRQYREQHAAEFNYNLQAIYHNIKKQEFRSKRSFLSYSPRELEVIKTTKITS